MNWESQKRPNPKPISGLDPLSSIAGIIVSTFGQLDDPFNCLFDFLSFSLICDKEFKSDKSEVLHIFAVWSALAVAN